MNSVSGGTAALFIPVLILVSIVGAANGMILTGPRVYYAMVREGLFFRAFGTVSARFRAPVFAIVIQGVWAACLTLLGTFQELFTYVIFTAWIFYGLAVAGVIVLRMRRPELERPFREPGYPVERRDSCDLSPGFGPPKSPLSVTVITVGECSFR